MKKVKVKLYTILLINNVNDNYELHVETKKNLVQNRNDRSYKTVAISVCFKAEHFSKELDCKY